MRREEVDVASSGVVQEEAAGFVKAGGHGDHFGYSPAIESKKDQGRSTAMG